MAKEKDNKVKIVVANEDYLRSIPEKRRLKCDLAYKEIVGVNEFGHLNNQITLLNKANDAMKQKYLDMLSPVPDVKDGTEDLSLRKAFDSCPSRYAQTPIEVYNEQQRIAFANAPEPTKDVKSDSVEAVAPSESPTSAPSAE